MVLDGGARLARPLRSRAARALKSQFMLLATGTPIENSMRDFWTLMDTAQPGLLGTWGEFAEDWVKPIAAAEGAEKESLGRALRETVGRFMLRRLKEDHLPDLPSKTIYGPTASATRQHRPDLGVAMPPVQQSAYEKVLEAFAQASERRVAQASKDEGRDAALRAVHGLRAVSLHPDAVADTRMAPDVSGMRDSGRLVATVTVLDEVRARGEKAIVFVINKKVQRALASWLGQRYELPIRIVNGETPAASRGAAQTRSSIIRNFETTPGFNVIIMSPLAVGVGLTVVGTNHAIHLERHWNPAKEAQVTDRIYRIGQTRDVHVYLPMSLHPNRTSFDENLDQLLQQKTTLREAIVVPQQLEDSEVAATLGLL
ncbi:DEAD/DEAH box helicase [Serinibacter salmoneus]|uniref:DEAD/DEAH box helicase n=1 Tax=Serinibacter salmoneus TaxID=556530 RepID=UPI000BF96C20|nr:DEAD/DEAH box helicase [Serinibacter salmoneus]